METQNTTILWNSTHEPATTTPSYEDYTGYDDLDYYSYDYNYSYYDYYNNTYDYYYFEIYPFEIITLGFVQPILVILTTLTNLFVVSFFLTRKNRGKATSLLFVSIAFSDTMTGLTLIPNAVEVYAKDYTDFSAEWCNIYMTLRFYVSRVFHTVSVWQTVVLSIQRYMCVCHPFISGRVCTFWKTFISIVVMYCVAIILHVYHLLKNKLGISRCRWQIEIPCEESCVYLWFCVTLQHFLPCVLLLGLTIITLNELRKAQRRLSTMSHKTSARRSSRDRIISITATLIVICFLIPELPHGIYKLVFVIFKHLGNYDGLSPFQNHVIICIYELALIISFNANFWIYCFMMHDFRHKLLKLLTCGTFKKNCARLRSWSWSSKGGSIRTNLSRTSSNTSRNRVLSRTTSLHSAASDNIHAVIPLTPTRGYKNMNFNEHSTLRHTDVDGNDDVFV